MWWQYFGSSVYAQSTVCTFVLGNWTRGWYHVRDSPHHQMTSSPSTHKENFRLLSEIGSRLTSSMPTPSIRSGSQRRLMRVRYIRGVWCQRRKISRIGWPVDMTFTQRRWKSLLSTVEQDSCKTFQHQETTTLIRILDPYPRGRSFSEASRSLKLSGQEPKKVHTKPKNKKKVTIVHNRQHMQAPY